MKTYKKLGLALGLTGALCAINADANNKSYPLNSLGKLQSSVTQNILDIYNYVSKKCGVPVEKEIIINDLRFIDNNGEAQLRSLLTTMNGQKLIDVVYSIRDKDGGAYPAMNHYGTCEFKNPIVFPNVGFLRDATTHLQSLESQERNQQDTMYKSFWANAQREIKNKGVFSVTVFKNTSGELQSYQVNNESAYWQMFYTAMDSFYDSMFWTSVGNVAVHSTLNGMATLEGRQTLGQAIRNSEKLEKDLKSDQAIWQEMLRENISALTGKNIKTYDEAWAIEKSLKIRRNEKQWPSK